MNSGASIFSNIKNIPKSNNQPPRPSGANIFKSDKPLASQSGFSNPKSGGRNIFASKKSGEVIGQQQSDTIMSDGAGMNIGNKPQVKKSIFESSAGMGSNLFQQQGSIGISKPNNLFANNMMGGSNISVGSGNLPFTQGNISNDGNIFSFRNKNIKQDSLDNEGEIKPSIDVDMDINNIDGMDVNKIQTSDYTTQQSSKITTSFQDSINNTSIPMQVNSSTNSNNIEIKTQSNNKPINTLEDFEESIRNNFSIDRILS